MDETIREGSYGEAGVRNDLGGQPLGHLTFQTMSSPEVPPSIIEQARIIAKQRPDAESEEEYMRWRQQPEEEQERSMKAYFECLAHFGPWFGGRRLLSQETLVATMGREEEVQSP